MLTPSHVPLRGAVTQSSAPFLKLLRAPLEEVRGALRRAHLDLRQYREAPDAPDAPRLTAVSQALTAATTVAMLRGLTPHLPELRLQYPAVDAWCRWTRQEPGFQGDGTWWADDSGPLDAPALAAWCRDTLNASEAYLRAHGPLPARSAELSPAHAFLQEAVEAWIRGEEACAPLLPWGEREQHCEHLYGLLAQRTAALDAPGLRDNALLLFAAERGWFLGRLPQEGPDGGAHSVVRGQRCGTDSTGAGGVTLHLERPPT